MKSNLGLANAVLHSARRMRQCQIDQIEASSADYADLLCQLDDIEDMESLNKLQSTALDTQVERVNAYWSGIAQEFATMNGEMSQTIQSLSGESAEEIRQDMEALQSTFSQDASSALKPFMDPSSYFAFAIVDKNNAESDAFDSNSDGALYAASHSAAKRKAHRPARAAR